MLSTQIGRIGEHTFSSLKLGSQPAINDYCPPRVLQLKTSREMNKDRTTFAEGLWAKLYPGHVDVHKPTDIPYLEELRTSFLKIAKGLCSDESDDSSRYCHNINRDS